jgi:hypothetical protein
VQPERVIISQLVLDGNKSSTRHTPFESEATEEESLEELAGLCEAANAAWLR